MSRLTTLSFIGVMIGLSAAVTFTDVLPAWSSRSSMFSGPSVTRYYRARLCGGSAYDGRSAKVTLNLQSEKWSDETGHFLRVDATTDSGKDIASNAQGAKKHVSEFTFAYKKAYSDIILKVTTGSADSFAYTVSISFGAKKVFGFPSRHNYKHNESKFTLEAAADAIELIPVWRPQKTVSVMTGSLVGFQLHYCFPEDLPYTFVISIVGTDDTSAFATYACLHGTEECDVDTKTADLSGWTINIIKASVDAAGDNGPVKVMVRGDGRYGQKNTFQLVPSTSFKGYR